MSHYDDLGSENDARRAKERQIIRTRTAAKIKVAIEKEGVEFVLADIVLMAEIHYRG